MAKNQYTSTKYQLNPKFKYSNNKKKAWRLIPPLNNPVDLQRDRSVWKLLDNGALHGVEMRIFIFNDHDQASLSLSVKCSD